MTGRQGLVRRTYVFLTPILMLAVSNTALASSRTCEYRLDPIQAVTLKSLRERNTEFLQKEIKAHPLPGFDYIEKEIKNEQVGFIGPRALQQMLGPDQSFIRTPAPSVAMDTAVNLHEEGRSFPVHVDVPWRGVRTSTAVYASLPKTLKPKTSPYLVGTEYPVAQIHLHGGGTPTATGKNAMSIGQALAGANIPVLALDLPGHGRATRQIDGFTTFKDQIDWVLKIADKLIDPNVKLIISGHSWGGEFTAYWRRLTRDPKYRSRIVRFITVSAPVDVSLGGSDQQKDQFDEWFERNYPKFEAEAAPADYDFMENSTRNGKTSTVGGLFTHFTSMDYKMPPLSDKDRAELVPEDAFVGDADILVWLGRAKQGLEQWGSELKILTTGMTWKGEQKTGHNVWDLMIEGSKKPFMYDWMTTRALEAAGPAGLGEDTESDPAVKTMDQFFRQYANFFLFRQFIAHHDEYVSSLNVPKDEREATIKRKTALEDYIRANQEREVSGRKDADKRAAAASEALRAELGLKDALSPQRAQEELALPPLTGARREELKTYLAQVEAVDADLKTNGFTDPDWDADVARMNVKYQKTLVDAGIEKLEDYKPKWDELSKRKNLNKEENEIRTQLSSLHQVYIEKFRLHQGRFGRARDARLVALSRPANVPDYKAAQRELNADRSEARRKAVEQYLARAGSVETTAREAAAKDAEVAANTHDKPEGVTNVESALKLKADLDAMEDFTYCPPNDAEACAMAAEIKALGEERAAILRPKDGDSLETLEKNLKKLTSERSQLAKNSDGVWRKGILSSPKIAAYQAEFNAKETVYKELYLSFEDASRKWLRGLKDAGQLDAAHVVAMTPELLDKRAKYYAAKAEFEAFRDQGDQLRWSEALTGSLTGPENAVAAAGNAAKQIWGTSATEPSTESLVTRIRLLEEQVEQMRRQESLTAQKLARTQWEYSQHMNEKGVKLPFLITRVSIREALDLSYNDLVARLKSEPSLAAAFRATLEQWSGYLASLRSESQTKDAGNY